MIYIITNERRQKLLKILKTTFDDAPITIFKLSTLLQVSARTIRYDLNFLKDDITAEGFVLHKKSRKGIWLEQPLTAIKTTTASSNNDDYILSHKERYDMIIVALLDKTNVAIDDLANHIKVSRNTLLSDLKNVQQILIKRNLQYNSKRGLGIWAQGKEQDIRDMLIHIFSKYLYDFRKFNAKKEYFWGIQKVFCQYTAKLPVQKTAIHFLNIIKEKNIVENDTSTNRMICALIVQIKRLQQNHLIPEGQPIDFLSDEGEQLKELSRTIADEMKIYDSRINTPTEIEFIMKELLHSRIYFPNTLPKQILPNDSSLKAISMAKDFIKYVQVWLGDIYMDDDELIYNLAVHLQPAIERAHCGIVLTNPLLLQIRTQYSDLFMIARRAAIQLGKKMHIKLSEDEIGYLTIHLGAAVERHKIRRTKKLSVLLVCGNGVGTANLLSNTLKSRIPYIYIKEILSLYKLDEQNLSDIDIIISTVSLDITGKAVLRVSPILTEAEISVIEGQLNYFYNKKITPKPVNAISSSQKNGLASLLTKNMIALDVAVPDWQAAIRAAGALLVRADAVTEEYVNKMVQCINDIGPYIIVCPGVAMPHARYDDGAKKVAVSFIRLKKAVYFDADCQKPVDLIFAFSTINAKDHLHLITDLWKVFTNKSFLSKLRKYNTEDEICRFIKKSLQ